jgi:hypothetical protein
MSSPVDNAVWHLKSFSDNDKIKTALDNVHKVILAECKAKGNYEAFIPVGRIEEVTAQLPDEDSGLLYGEDWEIITGRLTSPNGNEIECEYDNYEDTKNDAIEKAVERLDGIDAELQLLEQESDDADTELHAATKVKDIKAAKDWIKDIEEKVDALEATKTEAEDQLHEAKNAEFETDEVMWNTLYQYNGDVNHMAALQCGLSIVRFNKGEHDGEEFLGLAGCGMDLSPKFVCYQALAHGYVSEDFAGKIRSLGPQYFRSVVGASVFKEATDRLGITEFMDATEKELKARMAKFDKQIKAIGKMKKTGKVDKLVADMAAISALAQCLK